MNEQEAMVYVNWLRAMGIHANAIPGHAGSFGVSFCALPLEGGQMKHVIAWRPPSPLNEEFVQRRDEERINEYEMWGPGGRPTMPRGGW